MPRVVILLGAGATVSDVATRAKTTRPPLDKRFFSLAHNAGGYAAQIDRIAAYMQRTYAVNIRDPSEDSLETVMGQLYTDLLNPNLMARARPAFRALIRLFNERLASTTNNIAATQKRFLYRILTYYLSEGITPADLTIVTFNQDLQAEKILQLLASKARWGRYARQLFNFPGCYDLSVPSHRISAPASGGADVFSADPTEPDCIRILKLHGSLNWYSIHNSPTPSTDAMFNPSRKLSITRRRDIYMDMTVSGPSRSQHALPVVIPPVTHKSAVLHNDIRAIWTEAEDRLTQSEHLVLFGYSCPALDFESSNMLRRSQLASTHTRTISLIDPDATVATRYIGLLQPTKLSYYPSATDFLTDHPH